jgi:hypothetical protein
MADVVERLLPRCVSLNPAIYDKIAISTGLFALVTESGDMALTKCVASASPRGETPE